MQLDKTQIAVRERSNLDILDLTLRVIRVYGGPLLGALFAGVAPFAILNAWLLAGYVEQGFEQTMSPQYVVWMLLLVAWQMPLAGAPATIYLGRVLFAERPEWKTILRDLWKSLPQLLFYQGFLRPFCIGWPYLNEVILLERNPMRGTTGRQKSTFQRSRSLHRGESNDLVNRAFVFVSIGGLLWTSLWGTMITVHWLLVGRVMWETSFGTLYFPLALWIVASYFTVARFLAYLNLRIRREGWEVELLMRAESARLARKSK